MQKQFTLLLLILCINILYAQKQNNRRPQQANKDSVGGHNPRGFNKSRREFFENLSPEERKKIEAMPINERRKYLHSKGFVRPRGT